MAQDFVKMVRLVPTTVPTLTPQVTPAIVSQNTPEAVVSSRYLV